MNEGTPRHVKNAEPVKKRQAVIIGWGNGQVATPLFAVCLLRAIIVKAVITFDSLTSRKAVMD